MGSSKLRFSLHLIVLNLVSNSLQIEIPDNSPKKITAGLNEDNLEHNKQEAIRHLTETIPDLYKTQILKSSVNDYHKLFDSIPSAGDSVKITYRRRIKGSHKNANDTPRLSFSDEVSSHSKGDLTKLRNKNQINSIISQIRSQNITSDNNGKHKVVEVQKVAKQKENSNGKKNKARNNSNNYQIKYTISNNHGNKEGDNLREFVEAISYPKSKHAGMDPNSFDETKSKQVNWETWRDVPSMKRKFERNKHISKSKTRKPIHIINEESIEMSNSAENVYAENHNNAVTNTKDTVPKGAFKGSYVEDDFSGNFNSEYSSPILMDSKNMAFPDEAEDIATKVIKTKFVSSKNPLLDEYTLDINDEQGSTPDNTPDKDTVNSGDSIVKKITSDLASIEIDSKDSSSKKSQVGSNVQGNKISSRRHKKKWLNPKKDKHMPGVPFDIYYIKKKPFIPDMSEGDDYSEETHFENSDYDTSPEYFESPDNNIQLMPYLIADPSLDYTSFTQDSIVELVSKIRSLAKKLLNSKPNKVAIKKMEQISNDLKLLHHYLNPRIFQNREKLFTPRKKILKSLNTISDETIETIDKDKNSKIDIAQFIEEVPVVHHNTWKKIKDPESRNWRIDNKNNVPILRQSLQLLRQFRPEKVKTSSKFNLQYDRLLKYLQNYLLRSTPTPYLRNKISVTKLNIIPIIDIIRNQLEEIEKLEALGSPKIENTFKIKLLLSFLLDHIKENSNEDVENKKDEEADNDIFETNDKSSDLSEDEREFEKATDENTNDKFDVKSDRTIHTNPIEALIRIIHNNDKRHVKQYINKKTIQKIVLSLQQNGITVEDLQRMIARLYKEISSFDPSNCQTNTYKSILHNAFMFLHYLRINPFGKVHRIRFE